MRTKNNFLKLILISLSVLLFFIFIGCGNCEYQISDIKIGSSKNKFYFGEKIDLYVDIENPNNCQLEFNWDASAGKIEPTSGFTKTTFTNPCEAGTSQVILKVNDKKGKTLIKKNININSIDKKSYPILNDYVPSGFFDDVNSIRMRETTYGGKPCTEFTFSPNGPNGYAGVYYQYPPNNWGRYKGKDLSGYQQVSFYVASPDGASINFIAGGIEDSRLTYKDGFKIASGFKKLTSDWQKVTIDIDGENLSSVIGSMAWTTNRSFNPNTVRFYIRDIMYERYPCK